MDRSGFWGSMFRWREEVNRRARAPYLCPPILRILSVISSLHDFPSKFGWGRMALHSQSGCCRKHHYLSWHCIGVVIVPTADMHLVLSALVHMCISVYACRVLTHTGAHYFAFASLEYLAAFVASRWLVGLHLGALPSEAYDNSHHPAATLSLTSPMLVASRWLACQLSEHFPPRLTTAHITPP